MSEPSPYQPEPVCPRHSDRVSYVRCQRCGLPTCPECQRPAAVGVQCIDCVREGQKSIRMPRTQFGAKVTPDERPVVTQAIVVICVALWLLEAVLPRSGSALDLGSALAFFPTLGLEEPWRFVTAAFLHGPIIHIMFNMFALWQVGSYLEPMLGRLRFAILYLVSAVGGSVGYLLLTSPEVTVGGTFWRGTVGASGAVFGLFGAMLVLNRHLGRSSAGIAVVILINGAIGFLPGIAWQAHLGGLVTGAALAAVITATAPKGRRRLQLPALAAVLALLVVAAVARYAVVGDLTVLSIGGLGGA
jgi:membrane associated rhomboid family serine protease